MSSLIYGIHKMKYRYFQDLKNSSRMFVDKERDYHGLNTARMAKVWMDEYARLYYFYRPTLEVYLRLITGFQVTKAYNTYTSYKQL